MKLCFKRLMNNILAVLMLCNTTMSLDAASAFRPPLFRSIARMADEEVTFERFKRLFLSVSTLTPEQSAQINSLPSIKISPATGGTIATFDFAGLVAEGEILGWEITDIGREGVPRLLNNILQVFLFNHPEIHELEVVLPIFCAYKFPLKLYSLILNRLIISSSLSQSEVFRAHTSEDITAAKKAYFPGLATLPHLTYLEYPCGVITPLIKSPQPRKLILRKLGIAELMAKSRSDSEGDADDEGSSNDGEVKSD